MYDWSDVQSIVTKSLPHDALRRLRVLEGDLQQDVQARTAFLNRVRDRIDSLAKVIGEDTASQSGVQDLVDRISHEPETLRNQVIKVLLEANAPLTPTQVSEKIPGSKYPAVWRLFVKPNRGTVALLNEPFVKTIGFGRDRRYEIPKSA